MSFTYGFYDSLKQDRRYNAIQISSIFDGIIKDGVFMSIGDHLKVTPSSGMTVVVGTGRAWFNHTWSLNDASLPLTLEASELILDRIDTIALDINQAKRTNSVLIVKGTPDSSPKVPTLTNSGDHYQYPLAHIRVKAGITQITASNIVNKVGTSDCPFVTGIIDTISIDDLIAEWKAQWDEFYEKQTANMESQWDSTYASQVSKMELATAEWKKKWDEWFEKETANATSGFQEWLTSSQANFDTWFSGLQDILSSDMETKLASRILALEEKFGILASEFRVYHKLLDSNGEEILDSNNANVETQIIYVTR